MPVGHLIKKKHLTAVSHAGTPSLVEVVYFDSNISGGKTSNFFQKRRLKQPLPENDFQAKITKRDERLLREEIIRTPNSFDPTSSSVETSRLSDGLGYSPPDCSYDLSLSGASYDLALNRLMDSIKDMSINVAQAYAERQQTIDLVAGTAVRLAKAITAVKKGNMRAAAKALGYSGGVKKASGTLAKDWLALQYGWKPLLSDVYGAAETLAKRNLPPKLKFQASAKDHSHKLVRTEYDSGIAGIFVSQELSYEAKTKAFIELVVNEPASHGMTSIGVADPLLLAWELLPWSFVVDWFLPIGQYLSNLSYSNGLSFVRGYTVSVAKNEWLIVSQGKEHLQKDFFGNVVVRIFYPPGVLCTSENIWIDRRALVGFPRPALPSFKNPLSLTHMANALALLRGLKR